MDRPIPHADQRLGHVAIDMGLMDAAGVSDVQMRMVMFNTASGTTAASFGDIAVDMGYLDHDQLEALLREERRRRRLIAGFEILDILGTGLVSTVYLARQLSMERLVALKVLHPRLAEDPEFVRNYMAEAQAVSRFHHPHIVQGFDVGESNGFYYFAHEYLPGGSMADRLKASGGVDFSETRLLGYLRQAASALKHGWAVAVYHGDINPGNLLLDDHDNIKLANLGVPRTTAAPGDTGGHAPGSVRSGPEYAAPEQLEHPELVNAATDMYNLGATFYHLSFGVPPFPGETREEVLEYRRNNPQPSFSLKRQEGFSGKYLRLIHDMLEHDPDKRPRDPEELASRLEMFHLSDSEELAWQVRQVSLPSARHTAVRHSAHASVPNANTADRSFSLRVRHNTVRPGRQRAWAYAALALAATLVFVYFFLV